MLLGGFGHLRAILVRILHCPRRRLNSLGREFMGSASEIQDMEENCIHCSSSRAWPNRKIVLFIDRMLAKSKFAGVPIGKQLRPLGEVGPVIEYGQVRMDHMDLYGMP